MVTIRYRQFYICDAYSERSLDWPIDSLIYTKYVDDALTTPSDQWWKIDDGAFTEVPEDEVIFISPIPISKLELSGVADDYTFIKSDGSHAQPVGTGPIVVDGVTITGQGILGDPLTVPPPASSGTYFVGAPSVIFVGGLDVQIIWPTFFIDGVEFDEWNVTIPPNDTVTLDAADATFNRFDAIYMDSGTGLPAVITGTPSANPEQPPTDPTTQLLVTYVLVEANQTDLTTDDVIVYDEGTETTVTSNNGTLETDSTDEVVSDTFSIELGSFNNTHYIDFEFASLQNRVDFSQMLYYLWLKSTFSNSTYFKWTFYNGLTPVSNTVSITTGLTPYNFVRTVTGAFQTIVVPLSAFTWFEGQFDRIRLTFNGSNTDGFWFDFFVLQVGASGVSPVLNFFKTIFDNDGNAVNADQSNDNVTFKGVTKTDTKEFTAGFIVENVSGDVNPAENLKSYKVDTSGGDVDIILPDSALSNNNYSIRIVKSTSDSNKVNVTTVSGTQDVGNTTSLVINERNTGITVQSNFDSLSWDIVQDSRSKPIPLAITLYGLTESSGIGGYNSLASSISDADYSTTPTDQLLPDVTGDDILLGGWIAALEGLVSEGNVFFIFKIRKASGLADARFYAEIYHRTSGGTETLLGTSGRTPVIDHASYVQYQLSAVVTDKVFSSTDYFVVKFYGNKEGAATDPAYEVELEGTTPARVVLPVVTTPATGGGGGHEIKEEGTPLTQRAGLNFAGADFDVTDDSGNDETDVAISTAIARLASPALIGTPTAPTAAVNTNTTQIATTEFVQTQLNSGANLSSVGAKLYLFNAY